MVRGLFDNRRPLSFGYGGVAVKPATKPPKNAIRVRAIRLAKGVTPVALDPRRFRRKMFCGSWLQGLVNSEGNAPPAETIPPGKRGAIGVAPFARYQLKETRRIAASFSAGGHGVAPPGLCKCDCGTANGSI